MKVRFNFRGQTYIAPSKSEAHDFLNFWRAELTKVKRLVTTWKITTVEIAPDWAQFTQIDLRDKIEYR